MTTALEYITDALIDINALAPGQVLPPNNAATAFRKFNDLLDSLSTDEDYIYTTVENIFTGWVPNQYKYTIGNPVGGVFSGTLIGGSPIISGVTIPSGLVVNGDVTDNQGSIPPGTTIISFGAGQVTLSQPAIFTVPSPEQFTFTTPGDLKFQRPLRIGRSYTRITGNATSTSGLDYWIDSVSFERYNEFGYKGQPGPWPIVLSYQPTFPLGTLWVYPAPGQAGEVHLFTDLIFSQFTSITQDVSLPQGYTRSLKKLLALELCPSYGKTPSPMLIKAAQEARAFIKSLNSSPVVTLRYDTEIVRSQQVDAGWITNGGFT